jgi:hypothetical protein
VHDTLRSAVASRPPKVIIRLGEVDGGWVSKSSLARAHPLESVGDLLGISLGLKVEKMGHFF